LTLLERLKTETRPAHDRIERALDIEGRLGSPAAYRALLTRFYGFHAAWEPLAEAALGDPAFFRERRKAGLLACDLRALGLSEGEIVRLPVCDRLPAMPSPAAALGSMYVVEGSTLGGTIIARLVERRLGLSAEAGCAYFRSYGPRVGAMWRAFGTRLLGVSSPEADDAVVAAANRTFAAMESWLCADPDPKAQPLPPAVRGTRPASRIACARSVPAAAEPRA
jgi:heme oxygenase